VIRWLPLLLALLACVVRLQGKGEIVVGDEGWTLISAKDPLLFWLDTHPVLFYILSFPFVKLGGAWGLHVMTALFGGFGTYWAARISPYAGVVYALYPPLVLAGETARHMSLTAAVLPWFLYAWRTGKGVVLPATFMALSHLSTQVFLAVSLLLMEKELRKKILSAWTFIVNPLVVVEALRIFILVATIGSEDVPARNVQVASFLEGLWLPGLFGVFVAFVSGVGGRTREVIPTLAAIAVLFMAGRFTGFYALLLVGPVAIWIGEGLARLGGRLAPLLMLLFILNTVPWLIAYKESVYLNRVVTEIRSRSALLVIHKGEDALYHPYIANGFQGEIVVCGERLSVKAAMQEKKERKGDENERIR